MIESGVGACEVFPFNCSQVGLPARYDKTTITPTGILARCMRRKKLGDRMVAFEAYSAAALLDAIRSRLPYDEFTLLQILRESCAKLPDRVEHDPTHVEHGTDHRAGELVHVERGISRICTKQAGKDETASKSCKSPTSLGDYQAEPNSLTRQWKALLELARRLRRVPDEDEAMAFILENRLYSGAWLDNLNDRRRRISWIIRRIAWTFDRSRCISAPYSIQVGKYHNWARHHVGILREKPRRFVDEYGNVGEVRGRSTADWVFVSAMLSVVEVCFEHANPDQSLPESRARAIWEACYRQGLISIRWSSAKWRLTRDWLCDIGVIDIFDRAWHYNNGHGQAMKWRPTPAFRDLATWYKTTKESSLQDAVSLAEFLKKEHHTPSLKSYGNMSVLLGTVGAVERRSRSPPGRFQSSTHPPFREKAATPTAGTDRVRPRAWVIRSLELLVYTERVQSVPGHISHAIGECLPLHDCLILEPPCKRRVSLGCAGRQTSSTRPAANGRRTGCANRFGTP